MAWPRQCLRWGATARRVQAAVAAIGAAWQCDWLPAGRDWPKWKFRSHSAALPGRHIFCVRGNPRGHHILNLGEFIVGQKDDYYLAADAN